ncbi:MAG: hypothetical protein ACK4E8_12660, partial [Lacibacter sp.]
PASSNHIFCIARNTGQLHQKKHDLTMRAKIKTDTVYATLPRIQNVPNALINSFSEFLPFCRQLFYYSSFKAFTGPVAAC